MLNKTEKSEARDDSVFRVDREKDLRLAGPTDLVKLLPAPGCNPLILPKWVVETMVYSIAHYEMCHLSGPSGGAKSSLLEALARRPENFNYICKNMGYEPKPLWLFPVEMAIFESPGELFQRRSLKDGSTYDEKSILVCALGEAAKLADRYYPLIWLREIGRVHSAMVQGGLLNLMSKAEVTLPDGKLLDASRIAWVADSNYQAESDSTHTLVTLDDALKRRFSVHLTMDYLSAVQEVHVLRHLFSDQCQGGGGLDDMIYKVVQLGQMLRRSKTEGRLSSVAPPTIYGYLAFLRMAVAMPQLSPVEVAKSTLLGNAANEDRKQITAVLAQVFGMRRHEEEDPVIGGDLF